MRLVILVLLVTLASPLVASSDDYDGQAEGSSQEDYIGVVRDFAGGGSPPPASESPSYQPPSPPSYPPPAPEWQTHGYEKTIQKMLEMLGGEFALRRHGHPQYALKGHGQSRRYTKKSAAVNPPVATKPSVVNSYNKTTNNYNFTDPQKDKKSTSAITARGEGVKKSMWSWIFPILVLLAGLCLIIGLTIGLSNLYYGRGVNWFRNQDNQRIRSRRVNQGLQDPPAYAGPAKGKGGSFHYEGDRLVGWETWETPIESSVTMVPERTPAIVLTQAGATPNIVVLPQATPRPAPLARPGDTVVRGEPKQAPIDPNALATAGANA